MDLLILIATFVANMVLGLVVLLRDPKSSMSRTFVGMCVCINVWIVANFITNHSFTSSIAVYDLSNRVAYISAYLVLISALCFTHYFPKIRRISKIHFSVIGILLIIVTILSGTDYVAGTVMLSDNNDVIFSVGPFLGLYITGAIILILSMAHNLLMGLSKESLTKKRQAKYVFVGFCVSAFTALLCNAIIPLAGLGWHTTRYGPLATVILVSVIAYTIVKHRLFDIRMAVIRTIAYVCVLATLSAIYYLLAYLASVIIFQGEVANSVSISPVNVVLALFLAFLFQPIKRFFDKQTNKIFYKENYKSEDFFSRLSALLTSTTDLRGLLERSAQEISHTFTADQTFFVLYYSNGTQHHLSAGTKHHSKMPMYDARLLDTYSEDLKGMLQLTDQLPEESVLRTMLISHKIALFMPLKSNEKIIGYIFLGEKRSGLYTKRDINVLSAVGNEFVIAIQNALSLHEVKEINATLQQRIDVATKELRSSNAQLRHLDEVKDEFMSMASHQLRTPLTSIKGYMSMVLEGDMGKITPQQEQVLTEAFNSSERMVRLIADFLNVSRLQTGKFMIEKAPSDIVEVVRTEVDSLQVMAKNHTMRLAYKPLKTTIIITMDEAKIRQVIMNFIDNAIYYSRSKSIITVSLERVKDTVECRVTDTGIGVPTEDQPMLFSKFFRATNARKQRPDGTGVGLYLAKKVIVAHGGQMIFESTEGQGSVFGFVLPIKDGE